MAIKPHGFAHLGGSDMEEDARDLGLITGAVPHVPKTFLNQKAWELPIFYQGHQPACGAHAGAWLAMLLEEDRKFVASPKATWKDIKTFDGYAISSGTDMRSIFKSIKKPDGKSLNAAGVLSIEKMANNIEVSLGEYANAKELTAQLRKLMATKGIDKYGFINAPLNFQQIKDAIWLNSGVIALIRVGEEFWTDKKGKTSWAEKDLMPLRTPKRIVSGHFIVLHSFDEKNIYFANSFSDRWGKKGHGWFKENYLPFINAIGTATAPINLEQPLFMRDLYYGCIGEDVRKLQQMLNSKGYYVASSGAGSPGKETDYFGALTQAAVRNWQKAKNVHPAAGYFGALSRAKWKEIYG
jgi:hypothetical protein